jgi:hypothetical protein
MSNRLRTAAFAVAAAIPLSLLAPSVANATGDGYHPPRGNEGCTPGFWKNHTSAWDVYSPSQTVGSVFSGASASLADDTLLQALSYQGGTGLLGAERILLRAAVAALLNSTDNVVDYYLFTSEVRNRVSAALTSDNRSRMLTLAGNLDNWNNAGCPL